MRELDNGQQTMDNGNRSVVSRRLSVVNNTSMQTQQQFEKVMAECRALFVKKLHDYGAAWRILRPSSLTDQIYIKANRIRSIETKGVSYVDEGIRPEFIGIVNYAIIGLIQLEKGYSEKPDDMTKEEADRKSVV